MLLLTYLPDGLFDLVDKYKLCITDKSALPDIYRIAGNFRKVKISKKHQ